MGGPRAVTSALAVLPVSAQLQLECTVRRRRRPLNFLLDPSTFSGACPTQTMHLWCLLAKLDGPCSHARFNHVGFSLSRTRSPRSLHPPTEAACTPQLRTWRPCSSLFTTECAAWLAAVRNALPGFGAFVLCIQPTSWLPVPQTPMV